ncbi:hypothetical protein KL905_004237 [Ogataea polymorpha]|uniref:HTH myb-type domain-containing protein n=1 Tax=Ogataea polymorpha TaxID=460523 RepID=A0A9P8NU61_9ASCO|nr:hypothetical protein KL906_003927 [Ogataea polymorpha]KAG7915269.1 hypothetical protein KL927_004258 [Ogataea polymorpha]KAG7918158.1 hypothetical protein KL905_004237 [Ogataea polymorpha]KAG7932475.1 hypothetical protein KL934_003918 [Ogataea polymorpha]KAH3659422.1 hypothetical protein OGATHE_006306 [Ogataea polymorpha]
MAQDKQTSGTEPSTEPKSPVIDPQITKELDHEHIDQQQLELLTSQLPGFRFDNIEQLNDEELNIHFQKIIGDQEEHKDDKGGSKPEDVNSEKESQQPEDETQLKSHSEAGADNKENKPEDRNLDPTLSMLSGETTTFKGLSIPNNSELVRETTESPALRAYRELVQSQQTQTGLVDVVHAQLAALPLTFTAPSNLSFNIQLLINTLPVLDNLATQILRIISQGPYQKIMELVSNRESFAGIAFGNLIELFETTKRVYNSEESPFFTVENVTFGLWKYGEAAPEFFRGKEDTIEGTLRKVNLATFLLATLGLIDLGFFFLNEAFLDVFCPPQNLDPTRSLSNLKQDNTLQSTLLSSSYPFAQSSRAPNNQTKFLKSHAILFLELKTQAFISAIELGDRSKEEILKDLFPDNLDEILLKRKQPDFDTSKHTIVRNSTLFTPAELDFLARCDSRRDNLMNMKADDSLMEKYEWIKFLNDLLDYVSKNVGFLIWGPKGKITKELTRLRLNTDSAGKKRQFEGDNKEPGESTSEPEQKTKKARSYRQNRPTTFRRVWSQEEEEALRNGLKLKGTQWTAILELYGPGGSISEALKNRTTLQLKDKARNWKMYYLKNGLELPDYLVKVTGEPDRNYSHDSNRAATKVERPKAGTRHANIQTTATKTTQTEEAGAKKHEEGGDPSYEDIINNLFGANAERAKGNQKGSSTSRTDNPEDATNELKDLVAQAFES